MARGRRAPRRGRAPARRMRRGGIPTGRRMAAGGRARGKAPARRMRRGGIPTGIRGMASGGRARRRRGGNVRRHPHGGQLTPGQGVGSGNMRNPRGWRHKYPDRPFTGVYQAGGVVRKGCGMWSSQIDCQQNGCSWNFDGPNCH